MGKQTRSKKNDSSIGKGKVTPVQIAFIVDRYLSDNNFSDTRSTFRNEASALISKSPVNEAPKSSLSLGAILNEYIYLKEQKVMVDQERARLEHEKSRVHNLLQGMQEVMNSYNASGVAPTPLIQASTTSTITVIPQSNMPFTRAEGGVEVDVHRHAGVFSSLSMRSNLVDFDCVTNDVPQSSEDAWVVARNSEVGKSYLHHRSVNDPVDGSEGGAPSLH